MPRVMTDADIDNLVRRYRSGETLKELKAAFNIGHRKLVECLAARGVQPNSRGGARQLTEQQVADLVSRYLAGETARQLGAAFGISNRSVSDYLRRAEVEARPRHSGIVDHMASLSPEERSALASAGMLKRWQNATPEERARMLDPMHEANRGATRSEETKLRIIQAKERAGRADSAYEQMLGDWLTERGVEFRRQVAVGGYVADLAVGNVLVEVTTGWARKKDWQPRFASFFDAGWHLYVVWHDTREALLPVVADDLVAYCKILESGPPTRSQHRVIWRSRQILSAGSDDADYVAGVLRSSTPRGYWPLYNRPRDEA